MDRWAVLGDRPCCQRGDPIGDRTDHRHAGGARYAASRRSSGLRHCTLSYLGCDHFRIGPVYGPDLLPGVSLPRFLAQLQLVHVAPSSVVCNSTGAAAMLFTFQSDLHNYFISNRFTPAMFAVYSFGTLQIPLMGLVLEATNAVLITKISLLQQKQKTGEIILLTARAARKLAAVYFPVYAVLLVTGPEFISFLFTNRYTASWPIFAVNLTLLPLNALLLDPIFRAYSSERFFLLRLRIVLILAQAAVLFVWTRQLGLVGVISLVVVANIIERSITAFHFGRLLGVSRKHLSLLADIGKLALAAVVAAAACAALRFFLMGATPFFILAICGTLFAFVYLLAIYLLRIPTSDEYEQIREAMTRYLPSSLRYRLD